MASERTSRNTNKIKLKKKSAKVIEEIKDEESEIEDSQNLDWSYEDEDIEMNSCQKKILEDKVIKMITFWNDMDYIKNNSESFINSEKKKEVNLKEENKTNDSTSNINDTIITENQIVQNSSASGVKYQK